MRYRQYDCSYICIYFLYKSPTICELSSQLIRIFRCAQQKQIYLMLYVVLVVFVVRLTCPLIQHKMYISNARGLRVYETTSYTNISMGHTIFNYKTQMIAIKMVPGGHCVQVAGSGEQSKRKTSFAASRAPHNTRIMPIYDLARFA